MRGRNKLTLNQATLEQVINDHFEQKLSGYSEPKVKLTFDRVYDGDFEFWVDAPDVET